MTGPLRIAYISNTRHSFCTEVHVSETLRAMGHQVTNLQEDRVSWADVEAEALRSHMLLWTRTWGIDPVEGHAVLKRLADAGVPTVSFHLDLYLGLAREAQVVDDPFWRTALVVTADGDPGHANRFADIGINHRWMPPAVYDAECAIGQPDRRRFPHDVVFVGSHPYPHPEWRPYRDQLIATLEARYGDRFAVWPKRRRPQDRNPEPLRGKPLADLYRSAKVVVGDSCLAGQVRRYWSDRIPETLGRGGVLVHPDVAGLDECFEPGTHLATYPVGDFDALVAKVDWLLDDGCWREEMRGEGQAHVVEHHTYRERMAQLLAMVEKEFGFHEPARPAPKPVQATHRQSRQRATFRVAQGDTDATAVREVWDDDTYRLTAADVRSKTVLDVGANVGAFTVLAARLGAGRVVAYEPHPATFAALEQNVAANRARGVELHQLAVMGTPGFVLIAGDGGGAHVAAPVSGEGIKVEALPIATVLERVGPIGLWKLDVEGAEYDIFDGLDKDQLHDGVERLVMEFHGPHMPHLAHLDADGCYLERWSRMVVKLADTGRVHMFGHPTVGGIIRWARY